jgi:exonuclease III
MIVAGEKNPGNGGGVGFLVSEDVWNTVGKVLEVSSRILSLFVKVGRKNISMFRIYAPVNDATKGEKMKFLEDLRDVIETKRRSAQIVVLGDLNGRLGFKQQDWKIVGRLARK